ncbi:hypothetical protein [Oceanirhabdus sp. W0125-5]|uniref:hypothetical protein n=1 Tax=Oceanirhabdus sp. W0125-5 TaxID=2999116 RepID=UPI0022F3237E|nr:hypothetical protein [Oceanirhabdus sp. W0125-5]WBW95872.1 hypothetical protein OW730_19590 [Oceanirhabdus sp. W0125-5]
MLHELVGDEAFYKIIIEVLNSFKDEEIEFKDFEEIANRVSGHNLKKFFNEWIYGVELSSYLYEGYDIKQILDNII